MQKIGRDEDLVQETLKREKNCKKKKKKEPIISRERVILHDCSPYISLIINGISLDVAQIWILGPPAAAHVLLSASRRSEERNKNIQTKNSVIINITLLPVTYRILVIS